MVRPAFIYVLLLLAVFTVRLGCAQNLVMQSAPLPVIEGKINGMDVVAQGDSVAFFAGKLPSEYSNKSCAEDLHCTMHKNHTRAVMISPEGIRLLQLNSDHLEKDENENEEDVSSSIVLPSQTLNTLGSSSSFSFEELFISTEDIEPTPTLVTLYTGNPVVDQTPGLALVNSQTMKLLATTVETVNLFPTSTSSSEFDESAFIDPAPTETVKVMTTITGELDELRRLLISSATVPVPTPVQTDNDDPELESDEIWLEMEFDILMIRPSPSGQYKSSGDTSAFTFTVRQVGTSTGGGIESTSPTSGATSTMHESPSTETPQASPSPVSTAQNIAKASSGYLAMGESGTFVYKKNGRIKKLGYSSQNPPASLHCSTSTRVPVMATTPSGSDQVPLRSVVAGFAPPHLLPDSDKACGIAIQLRTDSASEPEEKAELKATEGASSQSSFVAESTKPKVGQKRTLSDRESEEDLTAEDYEKFKPDTSSLQREVPEDVVRKVIRGRKRISEDWETFMPYHLIPREARDSSMTKLRDSYQRELSRLQDQHGLPRTLIYRSDQLNQPQRGKGVDSFGRKVPESIPLPEGVSERIQELKHLIVEILSAKEQVRSDLKIIEEETSKLLNQYHDRKCKKCSKKLLWSERGHSIFEDRMMSYARGFKSKARFFCQACGIIEDTWEEPYPPEPRNVETITGYICFIDFADGRLY